MSAKNTNPQTAEEDRIFIFIIWPILSWLASRAGNLRKKAGRNCVRPSFKSQKPKRTLERKLQPQLHGAAAARPDHGIGGGHVRRGAAAAKRLHRRIVQTKPVLPAVRICEVGMVENVEELGAELEPHGFSKVEILGHREIEISEAGVLERVPAHVAELAQRRRKHHGASIGVAAEQIQRSSRSSGCSSVHGQCLGGTGRIRRGGEVRNSNALLRLEV